MAVVATCEARGINPFEYLADVLARVQDHAPAASTRCAGRLGCGSRRRLTRAIQTRMGANDEDRNYRAFIDS
jgi:hypothetical protein